MPGIRLPPPPPPPPTDPNPPQALFWLAVAYLKLEFRSCSPQAAEVGDVANRIFGVATFELATRATWPGVLYERIPRGFECLPPGPHERLLQEVLWFMCGCYVDLTMGNRVQDGELVESMGRELFGRDAWTVTVTAAIQHGDWGRPTHDG